MVDEDGFRPNVGIIITNDDGKVFWAKRNKQNAWQFPQGGIMQSETCEEAMFRELNEETGLCKHHVSIINLTNGWLKYRLPKRLIRYNQNPLCIGQKQKWFLLKLIASQEHININSHVHPEFDAWTWASYWHPIEKVVLFKREVYRRALVELAPSWIHLQQNNSHISSKTNES